jgi:hypothetical protein
MLGIVRTPPFRSFQKVAGLTTFHVNTIAIGLELVALGGAKPAGMNVKWTSPKNPREAVEQTKHFVLLALMTHVVDAMDGLLRNYPDIEWLNLPQSLSDILRKSVTKPGGVAWSIPERIEELLIHLGQEMAVAVAFLDLTVRWRNALVHSSRAEARLSRSTADQLIKEKQELALKYAGIDISRTLVNFESGRWPTLKEATTMIAVAQNLARSIDRGLLLVNAGTTQQVEMIARRELGKALAKCEGGWKRVWGRNTDARARVLANLLSNAGIVETAEPVSATLEPSFVRDLASADRSAVQHLISSLESV